jgi:hypothetical protein
MNSTLTLFWNRMGNTPVDTNLYGKSIALILLFINSFTASSQAPGWQWAWGAGTTGNEAATASAMDPSGNLYVCGWFTSASISFGSTTLLNASNGTADVFVTKYNSSGSAIWAVNFGGNDGELAYGINVDVNGNINVTGSFNSPSITVGSTTLTNSGSGSAEVFVFQLSNAGTVNWAKSGGGSGHDRGMGITSDQGGNIIVTGWFASTTVNFGNGNVSNASGGSNDIFVVKYSSSGNPIWTKNFGGTSNDMGVSVTCDASGNIYFTGHFSSSSINFGTGSLNNSSPGSPDIFYAKLNSSGNGIWANAAGGPFDDFGNAITLAGNSLYVTGSFSGNSIQFGTFTLNNSSPGFGDIYIMKSDLNGVVSWAISAGSFDDESGLGIAADQAGSVYVTGYFISNSVSFGNQSITNSGPGLREIFVCKYNTSGNIQWVLSAGNTGEETAYGIACDATGNQVRICGMFNSGIVSFGSHSVFKGCGDDIFVAALGTLVGTHNPESTGNFIFWFGNEKEFYLELPSLPDPNTYISFYTTGGALVFLCKIENKRTCINTHQLRSGIYLVQIQSPGGISKTEKIFIN